MGVNKMEQQKQCKNCHKDNHWNGYESCVSEDK